MIERVLTAREAFDDCLTFFNETLQPAMQAGTGGFEGDLVPGDGFEISLTVTHGALTALVKRYQPAEFTFHSERNLLSTAPDGGRLDPLRDLYVELTIDFTPYGTGLGGSSNDSGGGMTQNESTTEEPADPISVDTPTSGPEAPNGPSLGSQNTPSPATA